MEKFKSTISCILIFFLTACTSSTESKSPLDTAQVKTISVDPLPSWNEGQAKSSIVNYVKKIADSQSKEFIPVADRIATFDNDGTLWSEQPVYFQFLFAIDQIRRVAPQHPEWKHKQPFKSVLEKNMGELMKQGNKALLQIVGETHAGMSSDHFDSSVIEWIDTARHPIKHKLYKDLVYLPMLELIKYLQDNKFKVFIVSGGGVDFMRAWAEDVYGIPRNQIIGSSIKAEYEFNNGHPIILKLPELDFNDDKEGKPVAIEKFIGRKPVFAAGNSDGDLQMLEWTSSNRFKNFELFIHHTDSVREWSYDRNSKIGKLDKGLDEAMKYNWLIVNMKNDWKKVFP